MVNFKSKITVLTAVVAALSCSLASAFANGTTTTNTNSSPTTYPYPTSQPSTQPNNNGQPSQPNNGKPTQAKPNTNKPNNGNGNQGNGNKAQPNAQPGTGKQAQPSHVQQTGKNANHAHAANNSQAPTGAKSGEQNAHVQPSQGGFQPIQGQAVSKPFAPAGQPVKTAHMDNPTKVQAKFTGRLYQENGRQVVEMPGANNAAANMMYMAGDVIVYAAKAFTVAQINMMLQNLGLSVTVGMPPSGGPQGDPPPAPPANAGK
ncbi:hypothetical protein [Psittacicella hinzii]|uniref:Uncharacterized protein n=1 Tax=Psittacicella hinzii TaxID=2028575 RepID=A0A3A1YNP4_9GAMM|nr:hypothetical protein [Psittacicella hinzii]RIY37904.1 hypothetical protein CKF58_04480 [Psittacicella hinzii]